MDGSDKKDLKLKDILAEHKKLSNALNRVMDIVYRSKVLDVERDLLKKNLALTILGDKNPTMVISKSVSVTEGYLKEIFQRHAGEAAIRENR